jgi:hypothetical protein
MSNSFRHALRLLVVSLFALSMVVPAEAGPRRRAAGGKGPVVSAPGDECHTFGFVKAGLKASYLSTTPNGSATYTITYIFDNATQTKTTQLVNTPQGTATAVTTIDGEVVGLLRGMKHIDVQTSLTVPVLGTVTTEVDIDFVPSLVLGPAQGWCVDNTWDVAPVTETITTKAPFVLPVTNIVTTIGGQGKVLAVGDIVTAAGQDFKTVKYRGISFVNNTVQESITWTSMDHAIVVKQQAFDANGTIVTDTILTDLQF